MVLHRRLLSLQAHRTTMMQAKTINTLPSTIQFSRHSVSLFARSTARRSHSSKGLVALQLHFTTLRAGRTCVPYSAAQLFTVSIHRLNLALPHTNRALIASRRQSTTLYETKTAPLSKLLSLQTIFLFGGYATTLKQAQTILNILPEQFDD